MANGARRTCAAGFEGTALTLGASRISVQETAGGGARGCERRPASAADTAVAQGAALWITVANVVRRNASDGTMATPGPAQLK